MRYLINTGILILFRMFNTAIVEKEREKCTFFVSLSQLSPCLAPLSQEAQEMLPESLVVAAFQNVSAEELLNPDTIMQGDVGVCSDHPTAKKLVMDMADKINDLRGVDGGSLANCKYVEQITPLLVNINRIYKTHASIKIVGIDQ